MGIEKYSLLEITEKSTAFGINNSLGWIFGCFGVFFSDYVIEQLSCLLLPSITSMKTIREGKAPNKFLLFHHGNEKKKVINWYLCSCMFRHGIIFLNKNKRHCTFWGKKKPEESFSPSKYNGRSFSRTVLDFLNSGNCCTPTKTNHISHCDGQHNRIFKTNNPNHKIYDSLLLPGFLKCWTEVSGARCGSAKHKECEQVAVVHCQPEGSL